MVGYSEFYGYAKHIKKRKILKSIVTLSYCVVFLENAESKAKRYCQERHCDNLRLLAWLCHNTCTFYHVKSNWAAQSLALRVKLSIRKCAKLCWEVPKHSKEHSDADFNFCSSVERRNGDLTNCDVHYAGLVRIRLNYASFIAAVLEKKLDEILACKKLQH